MNIKLVKQNKNTENKINRRKLLGTYVFKKLLFICKKRKVKKIKIDILKSNKKIEKFWLSIGFRKKKKSYYYEIKNDCY